MDDLIKIAIYILIIIFILTFTIKKKLSQYNFIFIFLTIFLIFIIPSCRTIRHLYFQFKIVLLIILYSIAILTSKLKISLKILLISIVVILYQKNIRLIFYVIKQSFEAILSPYSTDEIVRNKVIKGYESLGFRILTNFNKLPSYPTIFVANYCRDRIENPLCITLPRKLAIMMRDGFKSVNMHNIINKPIYTKQKGNYEHIEKEIVKAINEGNDIFVYINGPSYYDYIGKIKSGIFSIAIKNSITITPVTIDYVDTYLGIIPDQNLCVKIGESKYETSVYLAKNRVRNFFNNSLKEFKKNKYNFFYKL